MADKRNDMIRERERRHRELVELKLAQQTDTDIKEEKPAEAVPKTFREKLANFWYHYKTATILSVLIAAAVIICVVQIATKTAYDCNVVVYLSSFMDKDTTQALEDALEEYCPDVNGDGQVNVLIVDCSVYDGMNTERRSYDTSRIQAQLMMGENVLFIVDDKTLAQLDSATPELFCSAGFPDLDGRGIKLNGTPLDEKVQAADVYDTLKQDYYICTRVFGENASASADENALYAAEKIITGILGGINAE